MKRYILLLLYLCLFKLCLAQSQQDSLLSRLNIVKGRGKVDVLNELIQAYLEVTPGKSIEYGNQSLLLSQELGYQKGEAQALIDIGTAFSYLGDNYKALEYHRKALKIMETINDQKGIAWSLGNIGVDYLDMGNYEKALEYFLKSLEIDERIENKSGITRTLNNIGIVYSRLGNKEKSLEYYQRTLALDEEMKNKVGISGSLTNIGIIYLDLGKFENALGNFHKALTICEEIDDKYGILIAFSNIGLAHEHLGNFTEALEYSLKALGLSEEIENKYFIAFISNQIGIIYLKTHDVENAYTYLERSLGLAKEIYSKDIIQDNYENLSDLFSAKNNFQKALHYYKLYSEMHDSIFNEVSSEKIAEMQTKYETEKKEKENEILRKETEIQEATIKRQNTVTIAISGGLGLLVILAVVMIRANIQKKKANILLTQQKSKILNQAQHLEEANAKLIELDRFKVGMTGMIVHDLKNPLSAIINYSEDISDHKQQVINQSGKQMLNMVMNILDVQKFEDAEMRLEKRTRNILRTAEAAIEQIRFLSKEKNINIVNDIPQNLFAPIDEEIVERVFINLLTNAIKFSPNNGEVKLDGIIENGFTQLSVTDSGEGIAADQLPKVFDKFSQVITKKSGGTRSTGLGLTFCKNAVEAHGGTIGVKSTVGHGSTFWFKLPSVKGEYGGDDSKVAIKSIESKLKLTPKDLDILSPHLEKLRQLEVFEVSALRKILRDIDNKGKENLEKWKRNLRKSIYAGNKQEYKKLININTKGNNNG